MFRNLLPVDPQMSSSPEIVSENPPLEMVVSENPSSETFPSQKDVSEKDVSENSVEKTSTEDSSLNVISFEGKSDAFQDIMLQITKARLAHAMAIRKRRVLLVELHRVLLEGEIPPTKREKVYLDKLQQQLSEKEEIQPSSTTEEGNIKQDHSLSSSASPLSSVIKEEPTLKKKRKSSS